jgi:hypothetical protein
VGAFSWQWPLERPRSSLANVSFTLEYGCLTWKFSHLDQLSFHLLGLFRFALVVALPSSQNLSCYHSPSATDRIPGGLHLVRRDPQRKLWRMIRPCIQWGSAHAVKEMPRISEVSLVNTIFPLRWFQSFGPGFLIGGTPGAASQLIRTIPPPRILMPLPIVESQELPYVAHHLHRQHGRQRRRSE